MWFYASVYLHVLEQIIASHLGHAIVIEYHVDMLLLQNVTA